MDDLISRQAAIDAFGLSDKTRKYGGDHSGYDTMMLYEIQDTIESMPSVNPQPKTGYWIDTDEWRETIDGFEQWGYFRKCSKCGYVFKFLKIDNYCPNCGTKMIEPQENEGDDMTRFNMFTDEELDVMESAFCDEGLSYLVYEIRKERRYRESRSKSEE